jgi:hypothetical protein
MATPALIPYCISFNGPNIRTVDSNGIIHTLAPSSTDPVYLAHGGFGTIGPMAQDLAGNLYVCDASVGVVYKIDTHANVTRIAGTGISGFGALGGPAILTPLNLHSGNTGGGGIALDAAGNIYLSCDNAFGGHAHVFVAAINMQATAQTLLGTLIQSGCIQIVAGSATTAGGYSGDGGLAVAAVLGGGEAGSILPTSLAGLGLDLLGNLFICDLGNCMVRRVDHVTGIITAAAGGWFYGTGTDLGDVGDGGPATGVGNTCLTAPQGVACDAAGNIYIADSGIDRIRAVNMQSTPQILLGVSVPAGCIQTVVGRITGFSGDGGLALNASISGVEGVAFDSAGNLYISDAANYRIRRVDAVTLLIGTVAGNGNNGNTGDNGPATGAAILNVWNNIAIATFIGPSISERRFATNGCFESTSAYGDVLKSLALSMAGFVVPPGDCWRVYAGSYIPPELTLDDDDCRSSIKGDFRLSSRDTCNGVKGQYIPAFLPINPLGPLASSPASPAWKKTDFPPVQRASYLAEDGGVILWKDIQLDFTISLWMAQRIASIVLERLRRQVTISLPAKLTGIAALAADTIEFLHRRWATVTPAVPEIFQVAHTALRMESQEDGVPAFGTDLMLRQTDAQVYEFAEPVSDTNFGDYSPYGQTGVGAGNVV